ncbi:hypothetical protein GGE65_007583 [Skermanella aerolata]|uniref:hypothetical protein n=1 Tax=Skermanella aerolata TaxID=393310 RepID=UPI003D1AF55F
MSIMKIKSEVFRFFDSSESEVLCITGKWGTGKTYSWKEYLKYVGKSNGTSLERYSYVSLFGLNSLEEVKYSIFENTVKKSDVLEDASPASLQDTLDSVESLARKGSWLLNLVPVVKTYASAAAPAFFLVVRKQLICIDDLERRGQKLDIGDVLGLASFLKEQRKCKVVILLNDEAIKGTDKEKLEAYLEKVVDIFLKFTPTPEESVQIALPGSDRVSTMMAERCKSLKISNVRVIRKIERFVRMIEPMVNDLHQEVFSQAVHSLVILGWSKFQPESAPPLDYLLERKHFNSMFGTTKKPVTEQEASWNALLDAYGFAIVDEFDSVLLQGLHNGFFDPEAVKITAGELQETIQTAETEGSHEQAWVKFRGSFDDNQEEVLDGIYNTFFSSINIIIPMNLNTTIKIFKSLGRSNQAHEMLDYYMKNRKGGREVFDLRESFSIREVDDPDVVKAFNDRLGMFKDVRTPSDIMIHMADINGWNDLDLQTLSKAPVDEYVRIFKMHRDKELSRRISACLQFNRISNATDRMREISERAKEALIIIGKESPINSWRIRRYVGDIEEQSLPASYDEN